MTNRSGDDPPERNFLGVKDAEIVHGPDVIADKVSGALRDADRFDLPSVKPPLAAALDRLGRVGRPSDAPEADPAEQNALSGKAADVDEAAGSAEKLTPDATGPRPS